MRIVRFKSIDNFQMVASLSMSRSHILDLKLRTFARLLCVVNKYREHISILTRAENIRKIEGFSKKEGKRRSSSALLWIYLLRYAIRNPRPPASTPMPQTISAYPVGSTSPERMLT